MKKNCQLTNEKGGLSLQDNQTTLWFQFFDVFRMSQDEVPKRKKAEKRFTIDLNQVSYRV